MIISDYNTLLDENIFVVLLIWSFTFILSFSSTAFQLLSLFLKKQDNYYLLRTRIQTSRLIVTDTPNN
jgi:hypothetical protein